MKRINTWTHQYIALLENCVESLVISVAEICPVLRWVQWPSINKVNIYEFEIVYMINYKFLKKFDQFEIVTRGDAYDKWLLSNLL